LGGEAGEIAAASRRSRAGAGGVVKGGIKIEICELPTISATSAQTRSAANMEKRNGRRISGMMVFCKL